MDGYTVECRSTKTCTTCGIPKPLEQFNKGRAYCKPCHSAAALAWARANPEKRRAIANAFTKRRREKLGPPKKGGRTAIYSPEERVVKMREWRRNWDKANVSRVLAKTRAYQAKKLKAMPRWVDRKAIEATYEKARALGCHVDHIVPLQSKIVCGLHVPWNLQLLPPEENWRKHNRHWPDMP